MKVKIYHGELQKVNLYSKTAVSEANLKKGPIQEIQNADRILAAKLTICGFIIICDWQHLEQLKISSFRFSEQSFWYASNCAKFLPV